MKPILLFVLIFGSLTMAQAQDYQRTALISKVTATWCPNCGSWGWDYMEALQEEFDDNSAFLLGVHHSGLLENPTSNWFSNNLNNFYQPQFFANNTMLDVLSSNWPQKVDEMRQLVTELTMENAVSSFDFDQVYIDGGNNIVAQVRLEPLSKSAGEYYFGIYIYENNVIEYQSQQGQNAVHPNVLRAVMSDNFWGDRFEEGTTNLEKSFSLEGIDWDKDDLGLVAIMWEKSGNDYVVDNITSIGNIGLLSSSTDIASGKEFTVRTGTDMIHVESTYNEVMDVHIYNIIGKKIQTEKMNGSIDIYVGHLPSGMYILSIEGNKVLHSKKITVN